MDNTHQFDQKGKIYSQARPGYPAPLFKYLKEKLLPKKKAAAIADVGAGTGIFTAQLLSLGCLVYAVEPNAGMRHFAQKQLDRQPNFRAVAGQAENTKLPSHSVDLVTAAQAFHWFNAPAFKKECRRILKPGGYVALVYNSRFTGVKEKELIAVLQKYCPRFKGFSNHLHVSDFETFFNHRCRIVKFANAQPFSREKYVGRILSSSYSLTKEDDNYENFVQALDNLAKQIMKKGVTKMPLETTAYIGRV